MPDRAILSSYLSYHDDVDGGGGDPFELSGETEIGLLFAVRLLSVCEVEFCFCFLRWFLSNFEFVVFVTVRDRAGTIRGS